MAKKACKFLSYRELATRVQTSTIETVLALDDKELSAAHKTILKQELRKRLGT